MGLCPDLSPDGRLLKGCQEQSQFQTELAARPPPVGHDGPPLRPLAFFGLSASTQDAQSPCLGSGVGPQAVCTWLCCHPQKVLETLFFLSHVFLLKNCVCFCIQIKRKGSRGVGLLHLLALKDFGSRVAHPPVQHRGWGGSAGPGSRATVPFSCLGEARPAGGCPPP